MNLEDFQAVRQAYDKAELLMKRYERINLENNPEVLKELECASKAIVDASKLPDGNVDRSNFVQSALSHCYNAVKTVRVDCMAGLFDNINLILDCEGLEEHDIWTAMSDWETVKADLRAIQCRWDDEAFAANPNNEAKMEADYHALQAIRDKLALIEPTLREIAFARRQDRSKRKQEILDKIRCLKQKTSDAHAIVEESAGILSLVLTLVCAIFGVLKFGIIQISICFWGAIILLFFGFKLPLCIVDHCIGRKLTVLEKQLDNK